MPTEIDERLAELQALGLPALRTRWIEAFGRTAPKRMSRDLLQRALAYRVQEQAEGGLGKATRKRLAALADPQAANPTSTRASAAKLKPGTRLVREWHGTTHHVTVTDDGFEYRGDRYKSLSQIARAITGARWSGPRFFGLRTTATQRNAVENGC